MDPAEYEGNEDPYNNVKAVVFNSFRKEFIRGQETVSFTDADIIPTIVCPYVSLRDEIEYLDN